MGHTSTCNGCGLVLPSEPGPVHAYVPSSPECWRELGLVQADELERFAYPPAHGVVVDAYMAQHPGDGTDRRDRQSVYLHLVGLCALHDGIGLQARARILRIVLRAMDDFPCLPPRAGPGGLTIASMRGAATVEEYHKRALDWAGVVWASWEHVHDEIRTTLQHALREL